MSEKRGYEGPKGGAVVSTESAGKPGSPNGAKVQSPSGLNQPKGPTTVAKISGK